MDFELTHTFDIDLQSFEKLFLEPAYLEFLEKNVPNIAKIEALESEDNGGMLRRKVRYSPKAGAYKVGPKTVPTPWTVFDEESQFTRASHSLTFVNKPHIPQMLRDKFSNTGSLTLAADGPGRVKRTIKGQIHVKIFLLGKIAERIIYKAGTELIEQEAAALKKYIAEKKAAA